MAVISGGRIARGVQKFLSIKGETVVPDLDSALQASIEVNRTEETDTRFLFGWRSWSIAQLAGPTANQFSFNSIRNPANSGVVAVIERWRAFVPSVLLADATVQLMHLAGSTAANLGISRDLRYQLTGAVCTGPTGSAAALTGTRMAYIPADLVTANFSAFDVVRGDGKDELVLVPGDDYTLFTATNPVGGLSIQGTIWWRERALEPSELTA